MATPQRLTRDDLDKIVISNINDFGWHCVNVIEDDGHPRWSYTIGPLRNLATPRTDRDRQIPRHLPRHAQNLRRRHRIELRTRLKRYEPPHRHEVPLHRGQPPLLLRLRGIRTLVLPQTTFWLLTCASHATILLTCL